MKKIIILIFIAVIGIGGYFGYQFVMGLMSDKVIEEVANNVSDEEIETMLNEPSIQQLIGENVDDIQNIDLSKTDLPFKTKEEAIKSLAKEFSVGEIKDIASKVQSGMSSEEKAELYEMVTERLTEEEMAALKMIAIQELQKNQ